MIDKGEGKGAVVYSERKIDDKATGEAHRDDHQTTFCRADGGFGGPPRKAPAPHPIPERAPDLVCDLPTRPEMALVYRLSADLNPLHADPAVAKAAGFPRPILHGLAHLRRRRSRAAQERLRLRPGEADRDRRAVLGAGLSRRDHPHRDVARRQRS